MEYYVPVFPLFLHYHEWYILCIYSLISPPFVVHICFCWNSWSGMNGLMINEEVSKWFGSRKILLFNSDKTAKPMMCTWSIHSYFFLPKLIWISCTNRLSGICNASSFLLFSKYVGLCISHSTEFSISSLSHS